MSQIPEMQKRPSSKKIARDLPTRMEECEKWIAEITGLQLTPGNFHENLGTGVALCMAVHKLNPDSIDAKYAKPPKKNLNDFDKRERITVFVNACKKIGVRETDLFMVNDLFEKKSLENVVKTLENLSSVCEKKKIEQPFIIGISYSQTNKREFTEEQILKAKNAVPKLMTLTQNVEKEQGVDSFGIILHPNVVQQSKKTDDEKQD